MSWGRLVRMSQNVQDIPALPLLLLSSAPRNDLCNPCVRAGSSKVLCLLRLPPCTYVQSAVLVGIMSDDILPTLYMPSPQAPVIDVYGATATLVLLICII